MNLPTLSWASDPTNSPRQEWTVTHTLEHESGVTVVAMSPSGQEVAAGGILSAGVSIWGVERGTLLRQLKGMKGSAQALTYSPDGRFFAVGRGIVSSTDICVHVFQAGTDTILQRLQPPPITTRFAQKGVAAVESLQYSPDSQSLAVGFTDGAIGIYEAATGQLKKATSLPSFVEGPVAYSPDGKLLAFGQWKKEEGELFEHHVIQLLATERNEVVKTLSGHTGFISALAFDPHAKWLASGTTTGTIREARDKKTNQMARKRNDDPIRIWDIETGMTVKELGGHTAEVTALAFFQDGHYLVSGSHDKTLKIWDVERGELLSTLTGHNDLIDSIAVTADGKHLVSGGGNPKIKIWERHP